MEPGDMDVDKDASGAGSPTACSGAAGSASPALSPAPPKRPFAIGDKLMCQWRDTAETTPAEVIETREREGRKEFYVHYTLYDRRLDEWVPEQRLAWPRPEERKRHRHRPEDERPVTRNLKRRFEESGGAAAAAAAAAAPATPHAPTSLKLDDAEEPAHGGAAKDAGPQSPGVGTGSKQGGAATAAAAAAVVSPAARLSALEREHEEVTRVKNVHTIELGRYEIDTWYFSPYPEEFAKCEHLFICEFCLKYMKIRETLLRHKLKCTLRHPPGTEIYRDGILSVWEVDGKKCKIYCQNLCLLAKLFLDHKTLYYDVEPFLFYVLTECDSHGCHVVGYFSKEKNSPDEYNLACILTLPPHQRKGYGRFLISFSYELSKKEEKVGTPEKPLSDLGLLGYRSYWSSVLLDIVQRTRGNISIREMSQMTAIKSEDIIGTLQSLGLLKYWKGQHIISVTPKVIEEHQRALAGRREGVQVDPKLLRWVPPPPPADHARSKR
eukprot:m51a1_g12436 putative ham group protein (494) ;mRNA; f:832130-834197